jgi:putative membrane protein
MRKNIDKKMKYITGGVAAMAMSVAACAAGVDARSSQDAGAGNRYDAGTVLNETELATDADTDEEASASDDTDSVSDEELVDKLTSSVDVSEKDIYKDETVYAFADPSGKTTDILVNEVLKNTDNSSKLTDKTDLTDIENVKGDETFTVDGDTITWDANGNDITYQGKSTKELPVNVAVSYYLDGKEVKPEDIAGKSGKVKIRFDYTNNETVVKEINGRDEDINVPFVAVTGMVLGDNFSNVTVTNGRSVSQGDSNIVIGFGMPGFMDSIKASSEDFSEDVDVPDYFEVEADVTDFSLDMTATVVVDGSAMNISGEIDTESLDDMMDSLSDATSQLVDGTGELSDGVATLLEKMGEFDTGVGTLKAGIDTLASKSDSLVAGIGTIDSSAQSISGAISTLDTALNTPMTDAAKKSAYDTAYNSASKAAKKAVKKSVSAQLAKGSTQYNTIKSQASTNFSTMFTSEDAQNTAAKTASDTAVSTVTESLTSENTIISGTIEQVAEALQPQIYAALLSAYTSGANTGATQGIGAVAQQMQQMGAALPLDEATIGGIASQVETGVGANEQVQASLSASATQIATAIAQSVVPQVATGVATNVASTVATSTTKSVMDTIANDYADTIGESVADACQTAAVTAATQAAGEAAGQAAGEAAIQGAESAKSQIASQIEATQANGYSLVTGASALAAGTSTLDNAAPALADGIAALKTGAGTLADGSSQLVDGVSTLNDGALTLKDGMQTYDTEAISKIVNSYNGDIRSLVERLSAVASASSEYDTFTMHEDGVGATTKFIIKTAGIEAAD